MKIFISLIIISTFIQFCQSSKVFVMYEIDEQLAKKFPWIVIIANIKKDNLERILGYGSLIHQRLVLTTSSIIRGQRLKDLEINGDCYLDSPIFTSCRRTSKIIEMLYIEEDYNDNSLPYEHDYGFLILPQSFNLDDKIGLINLVKNTDHIDSDNCLLFSYSWLCDKALKNVYYLAPIKVKFIDNAIDVSSDIHTRNLINDEGKEQYVTGNWRVNFLGSPLSCPLYDNQSHYVQVGIARLIIRNYHTDDDLDQLNSSFVQHLRIPVNILTVGRKMANILKMIAPYYDTIHNDHDDNDT